MIPRFAQEGQSKHLQWFFRIDGTPKMSLYGVHINHRLGICAIYCTLKAQYNCMQALTVGAEVRFG